MHEKIRVYRYIAGTSENNKSDVLVHAHLDRDEVRLNQ